jgi:hypothetical protein
LFATLGQGSVVTAFGVHKEEVMMVVRRRKEDRGGKKGGWVKEGMIGRREREKEVCADP